MDTTRVPEATIANKQTKQRIHSIDIVRGLIMIIMTLDHSRDFLHIPGPSPLNMQTTTVILFFTRWITHFCAPTFVFLSGVSAFLAGQRRTTSQLRQFLLTRGAWLILSDMLLISILFSFDPLYHMIAFEVLSAIGFGMILLALLLKAPVKAIASIALIILFGHNVLNYIPVPQTGVTGALNTVFLSALGSVIPIGANRVIVVLYAAIPWSGALLLGYVFGRLYRTDYDSKKRQLILLRTGIGTCILFIILRLINHYGDQAPWSVQRNFAHTILSFLNASKQPPSLLFFAMTLGPVMILLSIAEKLNNKFTAICRVYGNAPYFYFIIHICLLRILNLLLIIISGLPFKSNGDPFVWQVAGFGIPLWAVYLFWIFVVALLYYPCKWYGDYKRSHQKWWLSYI